MVCLKFKKDIFTAKFQKNCVKFQKRMLRKSNKKKLIIILCKISIFWIFFVHRSPELRKDYGRSESFDSVEVRELPKRKISRASKKWQEDSSSATSTTSEESNDELLQPLARWQCPPKSIWKPVLEAVDELRMINDGDSVLVNLLCDNSAPLLHTLHQLQLHSSTKGVHFSLAALTPVQEDPLLQALGITTVPVSTSRFWFFFF